MMQATSTSMQLDPEILKLQQEVEMLRLKDLQHEHHIQVLMQQLRSSQAQPRQVNIQVLHHPFIQFPAMG